MEVLRILHLFAVGLNTCTAVARSLCVSWAFLYSTCRQPLAETVMRMCHVGRSTGGWTRRLASVVLGYNAKSTALDSRTRDDH